MTNVNLDGLTLTAAATNKAGHMILTFDAGKAGAVLTDGGTGNGVITTNPPPAQAILEMPAGIADGAPVTLGTGPDQIALLLSDNPNDSPRQCVFAVLLNGTAIAGPLVCTSWVGYGGGQVFTLQGTWGPTAPDGTPHIISIVGAGAGDRAMWINAVAFNFVPLNNRADGQNHLWADQGQRVDFGGTPIVVQAPPPPITYTGTPSLITVTVTSAAGVVATKTDTLANLLAVSVAGDVMKLPSGKIIGTGVSTVQMTLQGAGVGVTTIDCTGLKPTYEKAVIVLAAPGIVIEDMTLTGATLGTPGSGSTSGSYASGVRDNDGEGGTLNRVEIFGCDMGIQSIGGNWALDTVNVHGCGMNDGFSHPLYFNGTPTTVITLNNVTSDAGQNGTHPLKTRAGVTNITGGTFSNFFYASPTDPTVTNAGISGSIIDVSNGGVLTATGTTLVMPTGSANILYLGFGEENNQNAAAGASAKLLNCVLKGIAGKIENSGNTSTAVLDVTGATSQAPIAFAGWASVTGAIVLAA